MVRQHQTSDVQLHIVVRCGACHRAGHGPTRWHCPAMTASN